MSRRAWTEDEIAVLRAHYARMQPKALARLLGRSLAVLYAKAQALGLSRLPRKDLWTPGEESVLLERFATTPAAQLAAELGRSSEAVRHRAARLGLRKPAEYFTGDAFDAVRGRGAPLTEARLLEHLRTNVRIDEDGCRIWASTYQDRIPVVMWKGRKLNARRLLMDLSGRQPGPRHVVYATCGKTFCMNEEHLRAGTRAAALRTKSKAGMLHGGMTHSLAIAQAKASSSRMPMCERYNVARMRAQGWTWQRIADHYGVHLSAPQKQLAAWERLFGPSAYWIEPMLEAAA